MVFCAAVIPVSDFIYLLMLVMWSKMTTLFSISLYHALHRKTTNSWFHHGTCRVICFYTRTFVNVLLKKYLNQLLNQFQPDLEILTKTSLRMLFCFLKNNTKLQWWWKTGRGWRDVLNQSDLFRFLRYFKLKTIKYSFIRALFIFFFLLQTDFHFCVELKSSFSTTHYGL